MPNPVNFIMWAVAVGLAYGTVAKEDNESWDEWDYAMVLVATWGIRKLVRMY